ncbi:iron ABC transporter permease [Bacillus sp. HMF5848]|uniref:FecCD family ABC transporter permease n=1 Tax=Bacillus sp. HMF5848 TaxID=2495421 RepID=UPI000F76E760|nr:iron ABC transporter permease [Bacillus sp. HMF5848]RSK29479.1 iron ABC transporter permease [Bacillus sp. HMF5848]
MLFILLLSIVLGVSLGQVDIPLSHSFRILLYKTFGIPIGNIEDIQAGSYVNIIWSIRFPRVLMAMLIGAALALCGAIMQATVQNPLADPYILGISSGATLGATFAVLIGFGTGTIFAQFSLAIGAFAGALIASFLVLTFSSIGGKMTSVKLVLMGMVINALFSAFSNFIIYIANNAEGIRTITFWGMGSLASARWSEIPLLTITILIGIIFLMIQSRNLNTMLLGDEAAVTLGINLSSYRKIYMVITAILTGISVASVGMVGFVGLIIPHLIRSVVGSDHRRLLPATILFGAIFLIWADIFARIIIPTVELPIGVVTAIIGAPMFMYMLIKKGYGFGGK